MGRHFDRLVDIVKKSLREEEGCDNVPELRRYLTEILEPDVAALFHLSVKPEMIRELGGKDRESYIEYLQDYFDISARHDQTLITPYPVTAVEDTDSVVIFDNRKGTKEMTVTACGVYGKRHRNYPNGAYLHCGTVTFRRPVPQGISLDVSTGLYTDIFDAKGNHQLPEELEREQIRLAVNDLSQAASVCMQEIVYIMDPANFIIRGESGQSKKQAKRRKAKRPKKHVFHKTNLRPHYVCLSEDDTAELLEGEAKEPQPVQPVRGHFRTLISDVYKAMRGQKIPVRQYCRGAGLVEGRHGMTYEVMVKESATVITPFSRLER